MTVEPCRRLSQCGVRLGCRAAGCRKSTVRRMRSTTRRPNSRAGTRIRFGHTRSLQVGGGLCGNSLEICGRSGRICGSSGQNLRVPVENPLVGSGIYWFVGTCWSQACSVAAGAVGSACVPPVGGLPAGGRASSRQRRGAAGAARLPGMVDLRIGPGLQRKLVGTRRCTPSAPRGANARSRLVVA